MQLQPLKTTSVVSSTIKNKKIFANAETSTRVHETEKKLDKPRLQFPAYMNRIYSRQRGGEQQQKTVGSSMMGAYEIPNLTLFRQTKRTQGAPVAPASPMDGTLMNITESLQ